VRRYDSKGNVQGKPTATAARFDEAEPAATKINSTANSKATSKTPAEKEKPGGRCKFKSNGKYDSNGKVNRQSQRQNQRRAASFSDHGLYQISGAVYVAAV
jgi:hypothetical protein